MPGFYSESGSTPDNFMDFNPGENRIEIGGVPAVIHRWHDDRIDAWVPFSAKSGKVRGVSEREQAESGCPVAPARGGGDRRQRLCAGHAGHRVV